MTKKKGFSNEFIQGYACAVATYIQIEKTAGTWTREVFEASGITISDCEKAGVDKYDLDILKKNFK